MAKLAQTQSKYVIHARFQADGVVEKPDVIGAVFGQTEGLLGSDMDLRELQQTGRIGRIEVDLDSSGGETEGTIEIPSSLDASETALIAATLETIERIGPCETEIEIDNVEDARSTKRKYMMERAKDILSDMEKSMPERGEITDEVIEAVRSSEVMTYKGLTCGPEVADAKEVIVCEGRADVLKLLSNGVKNAIAVGGTSVPDAIVELSKEKTVTAFLDGDRGGDLILKEMEQKGVNLDNVVRAPDGKEVEELTQKEIYKALRNKRDPDEEMEKARDTDRSDESQKEDKDEPRQTRPEPELTSNEMEKFSEVMEDLTGTRAAYLLDKDHEVLGKVPVTEMFNALREVDGAHTLLLDGNVDQKLINIAKENNTKTLVGMEIDRGLDIPKTMKIVSIDDLED